jgi:antirestriction protein ArdC
MTAPVSTFANLLESAVTEPGIISGAYSAFHNYSLGNQLLAWSQCAARGIQPGPIATFMGWRDKGRWVKKGEKALTLCRPVTVKRTTTDADGTEDISRATWFVYKSSWFVLAQTADWRTSKQVRSWSLRMEGQRCCEIVV